MSGTWRNGLVALLVGAGASASADPIVFDAIGGDSDLQLESRSFAAASFAVGSQSWDLRVASNAGELGTAYDSERASAGSGHEFLFELQFDADSRALDWTVTTAATSVLQAETVSVTLDSGFAMDTLGIGVRGGRAQVQLDDITFERGGAVFRGMPDLSDGPVPDAAPRQSFLYTGADALSRDSWRLTGLLQWTPAPDAGRYDRAWLSVVVGNATVPEPFTLLLLSCGALLFRHRP